MNMTNDVANSSVELVAPLACQTAENPIWHPERKVIFFTDIPTETIYEYNPATSECRVFCRTQITGGITIIIDIVLINAAKPREPERIQRMDKYRPGIWRESFK